MSGASNLLEIPFRRTHNLTLSEAVTRYITSKYDQHPNVFARDLEIIDQLRKDAVTSLEPHTSGIKKLQAYAAQLVWMTGKFPVDIGADFTWYSALGYHTNQARCENSLRFELANVVFNLAAMYSQIALSSNRASGDGLKVAATNFAYAAGTIKYLREVVVPEMRSDPAEDMDVCTLESLELIMLAQAQECFWQKAVKDGLKDALIAKLAAKVSDIYSDAGDWARKSDSISSEWIHHLDAKHHHFAAAAQYRAACDCLEKAKYGEEVSRLRDSLNCVNEGLKEARYVNKAVLSDLNGLKARVSEDLKRAEKDNDTVYLMPEPHKAELKKLDRVEMVSSKVPVELSNSQDHLGEHGSLGRPLFAKLVPYSAHLAASIYVQRRDRLINEVIIVELEALTDKLHQSLSACNLPGSLQALERPLGLPPGLISHAEEIRQARGLDKLANTLSDTEKIKSANRSLYQEGVELLRQESKEDDAARLKYGTDRWHRQPSSQKAANLYEQVTSIEGYLRQADESDAKVVQRLQHNESLIRLLGGTDRDIEDYVPSSRRAPVTVKLEREVNVLRALLSETSRLESRRRRTIEALRLKAKADDVTQDVLREATRLEREHPMVPLQAAEFDPLFDKRLEQYAADEADVKNQEEEQERVLARVREANESFTAAKRGDNSSKERETALQNLQDAYNAYKELLRNLESGRKFYNDLNSITTRFRDECRNFLYARRSEGNVLEEDLTNAVAGLQIQEQNVSSLRTRQQQEQRSAATAALPMPAPTPQRVNQRPPPVANVASPGLQTWREGMPIVFANKDNT